MSVAAEEAVRQWVNTRADLVGEGKPLALGAFLLATRSPDSGEYAVLGRQSVTSRDAVAEPGSGLDQARISAMVYGGTKESAEAAAAAYATAVQSLSGFPVACGDTGVWIRVSDNLSGPMFVPMPQEGGEQYAFEVAADFLLQEGP